MWPILVAPSSMPGSSAPVAMPPCPLLWRGHRSRPASPAPHPTTSPLPSAAPGHDQATPERRVRVLAAPVHAARRARPWTARTHPSAPLLSPTIWPRRTHPRHASDRTDMPEPPLEPSPTPCMSTTVDRPPAYLIPTRGHSRLTSPPLSPLPSLPRSPLSRAPPGERSAAAEQLLLGAVPSVTSSPPRRTRPSPTSPAPSPGCPQPPPPPCATVVASPPPHGELRPPHSLSLLCFHRVGDDGCVP